MAILKCDVCGGELEINEDISVGVCRFCDSTILIPKELDRKGNLYNRAVFLRQNNEFDKAVSVYEDILKEDNEDAEAHWGMVLSKYGIEYILDPRDSEYVPTCHRVQEDSILTDIDYLAALEYSNIEIKRVIENKAKRINEIQSNILKVSRKEPPYDVFICYKESDETGNRTEDSILAQDIYYQLTKKGYNVFFARKTLESKLGTEYEPIIYAALNSSKVMVVLGTKSEHFNAVWVQNEWSRYIKMSKNAEKVIIPAYKGMSPYELPSELSSLQSQDMSKIGFMQDLFDGVERYMRGCKDKNEKFKSKTINSIGFLPLEKLIQNGETYIKLNNFSEAERVYKSITKDYPEDYRGWWGLIVCKTQNFNNVFLDQSALNVWLGYVKQLAEPKKYGELQEAYVEYTRKVAFKAADKDIADASKLVHYHTSQISNLEEAILLANHNLSKSKQAYSNTTNIKNKQIEEVKDRIRLYRKQLSSRAIKMKVTFFLPFLSILIFIVAVTFDIWFVSMLIFILVVSVGYTLVTSLNQNGKRKDIVEKINSELIHLSNLRQQKSNYMEEYKSESTYQNKKINEFDKNIESTRDNIGYCKKYIELGNEKIASLWFSRYCKAFGVNHEYDVNDNNLRDLVLKNKNIT